MKFHKVIAPMFVTMVAVLLTGGASKDLTPASAKNLLQERLKVEGSKDTIVFDFDKFRWTTVIINKWMSSDYQQDYQRLPFGTMTHRFLDAGLVQQIKDTNSNPIRYQYAFTPRFFEVAGSNMKVAPIGYSQLGTVTNLLLREAGISATGDYTWHVDYNIVGQAIMGATKQDGTAMAAFRKQPDGTWICVSSRTF